VLLCCAVWWMGLRALGLARAYDEDQHDGVYRLLFFKLNSQSKSTESDHIIRTPLLVRKLAAITATRLWRSIRPAQPRGLLTSSRHCAQSCTGTKHRSTKTHAPHPANKKKTRAHAHATPLTGGWPCNVRGMQMPARHVIYSFIYPVSSRAHVPR
jgi:hypothetical protein